MTAAVLTTARLELRPITLPQVVAILQGRRRQEIEALVGAEMPWIWPSQVLVEQVFRASLADVRADPDARLWGDRFIVPKEGPPRVIGSVVFHGRPGVDGVCELAYGIEETSQGKGYGSEALCACVEWALGQPECAVIRAETTAWHRPSLRVLEKAGFRIAGEYDEASRGKILVFEARAKR